MISRSQEAVMPVVKNAEAREIPWGPGYRNYVLAGEAEGVSVSSSLGVLEQGAGAPLHFHEEVDEVIVVLDGTLDLRIGDQRFVVGKDQTISIPARTPHAFTAVGSEGARFIAFLPRQGAHLATRYLEGDPPAGAAMK
jgi:mannose-6-phosphate isomerase-like protein (cupin superfamily)